MSNDIKDSVKPSYFRRVAPAELIEDADGSGGVLRRSEFVSTEHAQGAWQEDELHMAAASGLLASEIEVFVEATPEKDFLTSRITFDILGKLHAGGQLVETRVIRPGRTIQLLETTLTSEVTGRVALTARTWRLITGDLERTRRDHDSEIISLTPREDCVPEGAGFKTRWPGGYIRTIRSASAPDHAPGHGRIWLSNEVDTVDDRETSSFVRFMSMADAANGVAPALEPFEEKVSFANVDLTMHFYREPQAEARWLGFATSNSSGGTGAGVTWAMLFDDAGPFGHLAQSQTVRDLAR